jgi:hypothetical protein
MCLQGNGSHLLSSTDGFIARPPFSGLQDDNFPPVISPRLPPCVLRSQPSTPFCIPAKRKRQRDSNNDPSALHSESGGSLPRRPRKRRVLHLSSPSGERLFDIATSASYDPTAIKHNYNDVIMCLANNHISSAPRYLGPPPKATMLNHNAPRNDQGPEKVVGLECAYEHAPTYPFTVNDTSPSTCLKDSSPVPAIDFTRQQVPSRNRWRFPLCLEQTAVTPKSEGEDSEGVGDSARPASNGTSVRVVAQDVHSVIQLAGRSTMLQASNSSNHNATGLPLEHQGKGVEPPRPLRRLAHVTNPCSGMVMYHMDQIIQTRGHATGCDEVQFATLWDNNAFWRGKRFWHKTLKRQHGREV